MLQYSVYAAVYIVPDATFLHPRYAETPPSGAHGTNSSQVIGSDSNHGMVPVATVDVAYGPGEPLAFRLSPDMVYDGEPFWGFHYLRPAMIHGPRRTPGTIISAARPCCPSLLKTAPSVLGAVLGS